MLWKTLIVPAESLQLVKLIPAAQLHEHRMGLTAGAPAATSSRSADRLSHSGQGGEMAVVKHEGSWRGVKTRATGPQRSSGRFFGAMHSNESRH